MKEVFGPFLQKPPKIDEIHKAIMHVRNSIGGLVITVKVMDLPDDILLHLLSIFGVESVGVVVEDVGGGLVAVFEDAELVYACVVFVYGEGDFLVEGCVVAGDVGFD